MDSNNSPVAHFPKENVPSSEKKTPKWLTQYAKATYIYANALPKGSIGFPSREEYREIKSYANGRQTVSKYKNVGGEGQEPNARSLSDDFNIHQYIPKYRRIALGLMAKDADMYELRINPIDALANEEREKRLIGIKAKLFVKQELAKRGMPEMQANAPVQPDEPDEPEDFDGLKVSEINMRHRTAMEMEELVDLVFNANDMSSIDHAKAEDSFDYGCAYTKTFLDGDEIKIRKGRLEGLIINYCADPFLRDWRYIGELMQVSTPQLVAMSSGQITEQSLQFLWESNALTTNMLTPTPLMQPFSWANVWGTGKWTVLDLVIRTTDVIEMEESRDKRGNLHYHNATQNDKERAKKEAKGVKFTRKEKEQLYQVKWVCGTDIVFDCGMVANIPRDRGNQSLIVSPYQLFASSLDDMRAYSRTKALIPHADDIQLAVLKLQNTLNRVVPKGYAIDLSALKSVQFLRGGQAMDVASLIDMFMGEGVLVYDSNGIPGHDNGKFRPPIIPLDGGVGNEIQECWTMIQNSIEAIRSVLGLNDVTDASTPNSKTLVPVANYAANATNNALSDLFYANRYMKKEMAKSIIVLAQDLVKDGKVDLIRDSLGGGSLAVLSNIGDIHKYIYSVAIEELPTQEEEMLFKQLTDTALAQGQVYISDLLQLGSIRNIKAREEFLAYKVAKNMEEKQEDAKQQQLTLGQVQTQSAQAAEQAKQATLTMDYQLKSQLSKQEHEQKMAEIAEQSQYMLEGKRIDASGRVEAAFTQAEGRDITNQRDNTTALIKEDKGDKVNEINIPAELQSRVEPFTSQTNKELPIDLSFLK